MRILNKLWTVALCASLLLACKKQPVSTSTNLVPLSSTPTNDLVANTLGNSALFLGGDSSAECAALKRRLSFVSNGGLADPELHTIVIGSAQLNALGEEDEGHLRNLALRGGNIVVLSPDAASVGKLSQILGRTVDMPTLPDKKHSYSLMAIKRGRTYLAFKADENETNEYLMGQRMDKMVDWLKNKATGLKAPVGFTDSEEQALQDLIAAQEITVDTGIDLKLMKENGSYWTTYHSISITYHIWKAHSFDNGGKDFYCIKEEITAYNQDLHCGPEVEDGWTGVSDDWNLWRKAFEDAGMNPDFYFTNIVYGPYMHKIDLSNTLGNDAQQPVKVEAYDPENSSTGGATVTESFSMSLGASMGCGTSGPSGSASIGLSWGTSVAEFSRDLNAVANMTTDGEVKWSYTGARPGTHWHTFTTNTHDLAKSILKNTCTLHHAWIWSIPATEDAVVHLNGHMDAYDEWLTYWQEPYYTHELYFGPGVKLDWTYDIATPPHYTQQWSMTLDPVSEDAENYLINHLGADYYWTNSYFFTHKKDHTSADTDDEISAYVAASKDLFDKNPDIMKKAAEAGGLTNGYTIIWQNLNGSQDSYFTYEVKL